LPKRSNLLFHIEFQEFEGTLWLPISKSNVYGSSYISGILEAKTLKLATRQSAATGMSHRAECFLI
jgi:hypothetical protein